MISIDDIITILKEKNPSAIEQVKKAYELADYAHKDVYRESGEPYITHPLNVALNLLNMEVYDTDAICAALLHDTVEDNEEITLDYIAELLNPDVAELVDGVTKMRRMNFNSKKDQNNANTRKIITGLTKDLRIILIKLADRLHNMNTLEYKKPEKQIENATETMELFVPLALSIGAYKIRGELADLSLKYISPDKYKEIEEVRGKLAEKEKEYLAEMKEKISYILKEKEIPNEILIRTKNICNIYNNINHGYKIENIYDLFYLKILVDEVDDCYRTLSIVHRNYPPINGRFKDYIYNARDNYYQSLHTTVYDKKGFLRKVKVRTHDMDKVSAYGISAYWNIDSNKPEIEIPHRKTKEETQEIIRSSLQFAKKLIEIDDTHKTDADFIETIKHDLLTEHVYAYNKAGDAVELPQGSTVLDYACQVYPDMLDKITGLVVNGKEVPVHTVLKNYDRVDINTDGIVDHTSWEDSVNTSEGKHKIYMLKKGQKNIKKN